MVCHVIVKRSTIAPEILKRFATRIGRLHQHKHAAVALHSCLDERRKAVVAEIRADSDGIGMPSAFAAKIAARVGEGRAANVVPLAVDDHKQALSLRMRDNLSHCRHAGRAELFKKRSLQLYGGHKRTNDINHAVAEVRVAREKAS